MALSGTLDTFALPDVLRLLASTAKTGRLRITGDRGSGSVWVESGEVVATELVSAVSHKPTNAEVVFGLLRFANGSFTFEADASAPHASTPAAMEPVLEDAEHMLVEWRAIEDVIPSLDVWVGLSPSLSGPDVMVDQGRWRGIAAIGSGAQVGAVAEALEMNEIESCRLVKELIELGLVDFVDAPVAAPTTTSFEPAPIDEPVATEDFAFETPTTEAVDHEAPVVFADETPGEPEALLHELDALDANDDPFNGFPSDTHTEPSLAALSSSDESIDPLLSSGDPLEAVSTPEPEDIFAGASAMADGDDELDPAEMARQLANLSPKAAKAVAAAARATTDAERDAALAAVEAEDDSVNRGLLLKFLGSVDS